MKAVVFDRELRFTEDRPAPRPEEGEALIRVLMAGICNTDLEIIKGYMGFQGVIGHEFVGVVEEINGNDRGLLGKRVVGQINCGCGVCLYCLKGLENHCPERKVLGILNKDGALAEYMTLPVGNLFEVPENVPDEEAVFTEPLAAAFEITEQVQVKSADRILVMGDGKLGLLISLALKLTDPDVTLIGKHERKLEIAKVQKVNTVLLEDLKAEKAYDIVVEATGSADGFQMALRLVRPRGTVVLKSTVAEKKEINLAPLVIDEISVIGSRCGPFGPALKALSDRLLDVRPMITGIYKLDDAKEAFERAGEKDPLKVIVDFR
jgi:threonine dehydrogenase-like Zn-dependent dehydrogenase